MPERPALIVFARAPVAGQTKTRLIPALGAMRAADLYRCFALDAVAMAKQAAADTIVAAAEAEHLGAVQALVDEAGAEADLIAQRGGDLGERIANAVAETLARDYAHVVVIGSDSPTLPLRTVNQALDLAAKRDLVLGPCFDGGYYLIGLRALIPGLFRDIAWSSDTVLAETIRRAREEELSVSLLDPWYDVDTPEELQLLRRHLTALGLAGEPIPCPRTWEFLRRPPVEGEQG